MKECDVRRDLHVPGRVARSYDIDKSGTVLYLFNSLGFRSEEYDPAAKFKICVVGESNAVGVGIRLEDTFGYRLKQHIAASLEVADAQVNLVNLSVAGASADYCVRTLFRQVPGCSFDLVICQLPHHARSEYKDDAGFRPFCVDAVRVADLESVSAPLLAYCDYYNEPVGMINLLKNALLAQAFLKQIGVPHVLATQFLPEANERGPHLQDYCSRLDVNSILWHHYFVSLADRAADKRHAGARSHAAFAIALLGFFGDLQVRRGNAVLGNPISKLAANLRTNDLDWKFVNRVLAERDARAKQVKA